MFGAKVFLDFALKCTYVQPLMSTYVIAVLLEIHHFLKENRKKITTKLREKCVKLIDARQIRRLI